MADKTTYGGRINAPANTPPVPHKHNVTDLVGMDDGGIQEGAIPLYNGTRWVPQSTSSIPNPPAIASVSSTTYYSSTQDTSATSMTVTLSPPATHTDTTAFTSASAYAVRWRYEDSALYLPLSILSVTVSGGVATVTTSGDHGLSSGDYVKISGGTAANNDTWRVVSVGTSSTFTFSSSDAVAQGAAGTVQRVSGWTVAASTGSSPVITFYGVRPGTYVSIQGSVTNAYGRVSAWSATTTAISYLDTTAPGQPATPVIRAKLGTLSIAWTGLTTAGSAQPPDYLRTTVHISTTSGFTPSDSNQIATFSGAFQVLVSKDPATQLPLAQGTTYYAKLVSYDIAGNASTASTQVSAVPVAIADNEIADLSVEKLTTGILTADQIVSGGSITTSAGTITRQVQSITVSGGVATVTVNRAHGLATGQQVVIDGGTAANNSTWTVASVPSTTVFTISSGTMVAQGAAGTATGVGNRVQLSSTGLEAWSGALRTFQLTTAGAMTFQSASTGARIVLDNSGLRAWSATGQTVGINADGSATFAGAITGSTVQSSTLIGNTIKTANLSPGGGDFVQMTSAGLYGYKNGSSTPFFTIAGGSASFTGTVSASTITGSTMSSTSITGGTITGASLKTASSGSRIEINDSTTTFADIRMFTGNTNEQAEGSVSSWARNDGSGKIRYAMQFIPPRAAMPSGSQNMFTTLTLYNKGLATTTLDETGDAPLVLFTTAYANAQVYVGPYIPSANSPSYDYVGLMRWNAGAWTSGHYLIMGHYSNGNTYVATDSGGEMYLRPEGSTANQIVVRPPSSATYNTCSAHWYPSSDNALNLGSGSLRWKQLYAGTSTIATSDARVKTDVEPITASSGFGMDFIRALNPVQYRFSDAGKSQDVDEFGEPVFYEGGDRVYVTQEGVRPHTGFVAQQVRQALDDIGLADWAGWTLDDHADPDSRQGLRYEEFIAPIVAALQALDARLASLENAT